MLRTLTVGGLQLHLFSLMLGAGILAAFIGLRARCKELKLRGRAETKVVTAFPFVLLAGAAFAHLADVVAHAGFAAVFSADVMNYGITFMGGLLGGVLYVPIHAKITKVEPVFLLNLYLPLFAIAQAWGRIGCFLGGCCHGRPGAWGFVYPEGSLPGTLHPGVPIFPIQLLDAAWLFLVYFAIRHFVSFRHAAATYLLLLSAGRFASEFLRGDDRGAFAGVSLSPSQTLALVFFALGLFLILSKKAQRDQAPPLNAKKSAP